METADDKKPHRQGNDARTAILQQSGVAHTQQGTPIERAVLPRVCEVRDTNIRESNRPHNTATDSVAPKTGKE